MPQTDLFALSSPEVQKEFNDLFAFAKKEGALNDTCRDHYAQRFAADPHGTRQEIDTMISGALQGKVGLDAVHVSVREMPGYPNVSPSDATAYPESWV
jgi:hypothetical protein